MTVQGVTRIERASFTTADFDADNRVANKREASFPFKNLISNRALIMRGVSSQVKEDTKVTTLKLYPDRKHGQEYCYNNIKDQTIKEVITPKPAPIPNIHP